MTPCSDAMIKNILTVTPDQTVNEVLEIFEKNDIRSVPVVDQDGKLMGLFGLKHILLGLLHISLYDSLPLQFVTIHVLYHAHVSFTIPNTQTLLRDNNLEIQMYCLDSSLIA